MVDPAHPVGGWVAGFTLLEILITVLITAMVMTAFYGILYSTIEVRDVIDEAIEGSEIGSTLLNSIRQDLDGAFLPGNDKEYFVGKDIKEMGVERDRLDFVTETIAVGKEDLEGIPQSTPDDKDLKKNEEKIFSVSEVGYQLKQNDKEPGFYVLYRRQQLWLDDKPVEGGRLMEIFDRVKSFNIAYYDGTNWLSEWSNIKNKGLPSAVKIDITISTLSQRGGNTKEKELTFSTIIKLSID